MNLVFVSLFGLTELYRAIGRRLEPDGHCIFWITTNQHWTHLLMQDGVPRERILELVYTAGDFIDAAAQARIQQELVECERGCDLTVHQCLLMDRFLTERPRADILEYVYLYYRDMKRFLIEHKIDYVFAEPTNLNDMLAYMICRELGIRYRSPRDMRFPSGRTVFFKDYRQAQIVPRLAPEPGVDGRRLIAEFSERQTAPFYFKRLAGDPVIQATRIAGAVARRWRMRRTLHQPSLTHYDVWGRVKLTAGRFMRSCYMRRLCRYDSLASIDGPVAYYGLHVQPENAVDVLGSYFSDQLKLIKDMRRALPCDTTLVVKEHPTFLGQRTVRFFRELRRLPGVKLVDYRVSSFDIYRRSSLVLTISGTTAYEAGLLGIPAVTFSPMYFGGFSTIRYCPDVSGLKGVIESLRESCRRGFDADGAVLRAHCRRFIPALVERSVFRSIITLGRRMSRT
jgi:hypothetical protein